MNAFFFRQFRMNLNCISGRCYMRILSIGLIAAVSLGLGGCAYGGVGVGTGYGGGYGYDNYGYGYDNYGYGYSPYGYNGYYAPAGWYNGYYYPGNGGWAYSRDGRRHEANFGNLGDAFRRAVKDRNAATTTGTTAVTTTSRVSAPARTRVIERTERAQRPAAREDRSTSGANRIFQVIRDKKKND